MIELVEDPEIGWEAGPREKAARDRAYKLLTSKGYKCKKRSLYQGVDIGTVYWLECKGKIPETLLFKTKFKHWL